MMVRTPWRWWLYALLIRARPAPLGSALKKVCGIKRQVIQTTHGQFFIDPASFLGYMLLTTGEYEENVRRCPQRALKPGQVFLDVGANKGYFSVIASHLVGQQGLVVAVEPQTRLKPYLEKNWFFRHFRVIIY